ncbi:MAG: hypothetical protein AB7O32_00455 [Vicinamibacterales bacterium]
MRVVIPSVGYGDFLAHTLPAWRRLVPPSARVTVVTAADDRETQDVAAAVDGVSVCVTDVWRLEGRPFNKGAALDLAFGFRPGWTSAPTPRETCLALDADVYPFGRSPNRRLLRTGILYGATRYHCPTPADLAKHRAGLTPRSTLLIIQQRRRGAEPALAPDEAVARTSAAQACLGYFQLFRYRPGLAFGHSRSAGKYDNEFRRHFESRHAIDSLYLLHLGALSRANWTGRVVGRWGAP